jgi:hypothetical protein
VMMAPDIGTIPDRMPKRTQTGNWSFPKLAAKERHGFYGLMVFGHVLVTIREAFAAAPAINSIRIAIVRQTVPNAYGVRRLECLLAAMFKRTALQGIQWQSADAATIVEDASTETRIRLGAMNELRPLDLSKEPELAALLQTLN